MKFLGRVCVRSGSSARIGARAGGRGRHLGPVDTAHPGPGFLPGPVQRFALGRKTQDCSILSDPERPKQGGVKREGRVDPVFGMPGSSSRVPVAGGGGQSGLAVASKFVVRMEGQKSTYTERRTSGCASS